MIGERELDDALRNLARSAGDVPENPDTERRLLVAFDRRHAVRPGSPSAGQAPHGDRWRGGARWALAAAAVLALSAGGWWVTRDGGHGAANVASATRTASAAAVPGPATEPPRAMPAVEVSRPQASAASDTAAPHRSRPADSESRPRPAALETTGEADEFVELPAAARLPRFESGVIVRVELDVTSLPAYGFSIMPDSTRRPVAADVLVGQDGQPRAIRLVSVQSESRRRQ